MEIASIVLALGAFVLASASALWIWVYSTPRSYQKRLDAAEARIELAIGGIEQMEQVWIRYRAELQQLGEVIEHGLEATEKKRRQAAASESNAKRREGGEVIELTREEARNQVRARVYGGGR